MTSPTKHNKRRDQDVMKLLMSDWKVDLVNDCTNEFQVEFNGPKESPYEGGRWKIRVELPDAYPYKSPSIGFMNRIYHPNVDEMAGSVCLDVINQTWSPMFDLMNVFEVFLPQLLLYPNPTDPLNGEAAKLLIQEPDVYSSKVKDYVRQYASSHKHTDGAWTKPCDDDSDGGQAATDMEADNDEIADSDDDNEPRMDGFLSSSDDDP